MQSLLANAEQQGVIFSHSTSVESIKLEDQGLPLVYPIIDDGRLRQPYALRTKILINCAGLGALNLAAMVFDELEIADSRPQQRQHSRTAFEQRQLFRLHGQKSIHAPHLSTARQ